MTEPRFYVYTLADPDDGIVFYVGKGQRERAWQHTKDVRADRKPTNSGKIAKIKAILARGLEPFVNIVQRFDLEKDALELEAQMIAAIPDLTNIASRGALSARVKVIKRQIAAAPKPTKAMLKTHWYLKNWLAWAKTWPYGATIPNHPNGDALGAEFMEMVEQLVKTGDEDFYGTGGQALKSGDY